jgi:hypothetical protein
MDLDGGPHELGHAAIRTDQVEPRQVGLGRAPRPPHPGECVEILEDLLNACVFPSSSFILTHALAHTAAKISALLNAHKQVDIRHGPVSHSNQTPCVLAAELID